MHFLFQSYDNSPIFRANLHPSVKKLVRTEQIERTDKLPGVIINYLMTLFEIVEFLQNCNGNNNIMFLKVVQTGTVMEYNVCIDDKNFLFLHQKTPKKLYGTRLFSPKSRIKNNKG